MGAAWLELGFWAMGGTRMGSLKPCPLSIDPRGTPTCGGSPPGSSLSTEDVCVTGGQVGRRDRWHFPWEGFTGEDQDPQDQDPQFLQGQPPGLSADREEEVQTLPGMTMPGKERSASRCPKGCLRRKGHS